MPLTRGFIGLLHHLKWHPYLTFRTVTQLNARAEKPVT